ncbi:universal stress protein [Nonomuraea rubra]|uniref:universal stress protein n=2 Tax=Nonomuraea rubra TaxID=46180 RepID=UPI003133C6A6
MAGRTGNNPRQRGGNSEECSSADRGDRRRHRKHAGPSPAYSRFQRSVNLRRKSGVAMNHVIVVGADGSDAATAAVEWAADDAARAGASTASCFRAPPRRCCAARPVTPPRS